MEAFGCPEPLRGSGRAFFTAFPQRFSAQIDLLQTTVMSLVENQPTSKTHPKRTILSQSAGYRKSPAVTEDTEKTNK